MQLSFSVRLGIHPLIAFFFFWVLKKKYSTQFQTCGVQRNTHSFRVLSSLFFFFTWESLDKSGKLRKLVLEDKSRKRNVVWLWVGSGADKERLDIIGDIGSVEGEHLGQDDARG